MNKTVLSLSKTLVALLIITSFYYCEKDSVVDSINSEASIPSEKSRIYVNKGAEVTEGIVQFLQTKSNNTFRVNFDKRNISLSNGSNSESDNNTMGIISLDKEVVVINPYNTTHTFKVITPATIDAKVNLIVIETEVHIYEYFLKYNQTSISTNNTFTGTIETFDSDGNLIGTSTVENGVITNVDGNTQPDCEDEDIIIDDSDDITDPSTSSGSDSSVPSSNDSSTDSPPANGSDGGEIHNPDIPCAITHYYTCNRGFSDPHQPRGEPECSGTSPSSTTSGGSILVFNDCPNNLESTNTRINPCEGDVGVILDEEELCGMSDEDFNSYYSSKSPFNVDLSEVRESCNTINLSENEKFMCIYNKLIKSPLFKNMFHNTFGENQQLNVTFQVVDNLPDRTAGLTGQMPGTIATRNPNTGEINLHLRIRINKNYMDEFSAMAVAKTILHESIHTYLILKHIDCNAGTPIEEVIVGLTNVTFEELLNSYYASACDNQEQHEFMYDKMLPVFSNILASVRDDLIPESQRVIAEADQTFKNETNPDGNNLFFNWNEFYKNLSLRGLQHTNYFVNNIESNPNKYFNFARYADDYAKVIFEKDCIN